MKKTFGSILYCLSILLFSSCSLFSDGPSDSFIIDAISKEQENCNCGTYCTNKYINRLAVGLSHDIHFEFISAKIVDRGEYNDKTKRQKIRFILTVKSGLCKSSGANRVKTREIKDECWVRKNEFGDWEVKYGGGIF